MIYFTADTHFYHTKILELNKRPFSNINEMNEILIANWNACVGYEDEIYILGDFSFFKRGAVDVNNLLVRLSGKKYLIRGNHDYFLDEKDFNPHDFEWIKDYYLLSYQNMKFALFHFPIYSWERGAIHLHGHVHNREGWTQKSAVLGQMAFNVGVDVNNYRPVSIEEVIKRCIG